MQKLHLLNQEIGTLREAELTINSFYWFLTVDEIAGEWIVKTGETIVMTADSREAIDAFLYGMALAYKGLSPHLYAKLFATMAGDDVPEDKTKVDLDIADNDDERLSDLDINTLEPIDVDLDDDGRFSFD
ncbi:MAG: hypothetical protein WBC91_12425 [Phototrophicaceae bacterium]